MFWSFEIKHVDELAVQQRCAEIFTDQSGGAELTKATERCLRLLPWKCGTCVSVCRSVDYREREADLNYCECEMDSCVRPHAPISFDIVDEWIEEYEQHILLPGSDKVCNMCVKRQSVRIGSKVHWEE